MKAKPMKHLLTVFTALLLALRTPLASLHAADLALSTNGRINFQILTFAFALLTVPLRAQTDADFQKTIQPLLSEFCMDCHDNSTAKGKLSLEAIDPKVAGADLEKWRILAERIRFHDMPPEKTEEKPSDAQRAVIVDWIRRQLLVTQQSGYAADERFGQPEYGNYVDHAALFAEPAGPVIPGPPRLWRMRPAIYERHPAGTKGMTRKLNLSDPLPMTGGSEFTDYASRYFVDEPSTEMLMANAEKVVPEQAKALIESLGDLDKAPQSEALSAAIRKAFELFLQRAATDEEVQRHFGFYDAVAKTSGHRLAVNRLLMTIVLKPEALYREELGEGAPDEHGRVRLSPLEMARALSFALGDTLDGKMLAAAASGKLTTREQMRKLIEFRFAEPLKKGAETTRIPQFFQEFFHYPNAAEVFKDRPKPGYFLPHLLIADLERLILHHVEQDRDVLFHLLTTDEYFVDFAIFAPTGQPYQPSMQQASNGNNPVTSDPEYATLYGLPRDWMWTAKQPIALPKGQRAGLLTHPAWLAAWSGNFDNHPVQRGIWIRTHLLGGTIPNVPICVDAQVPEGEGKQFRERLVAVTSAADCRRCHKKMDPLGLPFEQYDHYGRYRRTELGRPVETNGAITFVEDDALIGPVTGAADMMQRLAKSQHVEQVFVRYAFRFFLGRNETLGDAGTLQAAHKAYRDNGGSFKAMVTSLLLSDSFLLRKVATNSN